MREPPSGGPVTGGQYFGCLLMVVGGLIAVTAGACSAVSVFSGFLSGAGGANSVVHSAGEALILALIFGGIPFAVGAGLFFLGRRMYRQPVRGEYEP